MGLVKREDFLKKYMERFNHKIWQEAEDRIPPLNYEMENIEIINKVIREIVKEI